MTRTRLVAWILGLAGSASALLAALAALLPGCGGGGGGGGGPSYAAQRSWSALPFANGYMAGVYDLSIHKVSIFRTPIYASRAQGSPTQDYCYDLLFGARQNGQSRWLDTVPEEGAGYLPGTGIVRTLQRVGAIEFECFYFAPLFPAAKAEAAMVAILHATNRGAQATDCSLFALMNFHLGGDADETNEWAWFYRDPAAGVGAIMEGKANTSHRAVYRTIGDQVSRSATPSISQDNPWARVNASEHLVDGNQATNPTNDVICGFESAINAGQPFLSGAEAWLGVVVALREDVQQGPAELDFQDAVDAFIASRTPEKVLEDEQALWAAYHAVERLPPGISTADAALYRQSTAILKMAQVRVPNRGAGHGQILASLPPGQWNIAWLRDGCYAIAALARSGHVAEAREGLEFFLGGTADKYRNYFHNNYNYGVGTPYKLSVCRYFGEGGEESDDNGNGPNIEFDGFGLFLWALKAYADADPANGPAFAGQHWQTISQYIADLLAKETNQAGLIDPATDLLKPDSSIWERHIKTAPGTPDGAKQFAFSSIAAARGLRAAAALAALASPGPNDQARAASYQAAANRIAQGIDRNLRLGDVLCSSREDRLLGRDDSDGAVVEAFLEEGRLYEPSSTVGSATLAAFDAALRPASWAGLSPGYRRSDDYKDYSPPGDYDLREWVFIDLRIASALSRSTARRADARVLLDWVRAQAAENFNLIPELLTEQAARYAGAVPMVGFGAGAFVLAMDDYYR